MSSSTQDALLTVVPRSHAPSEGANPDSITDALYHTLRTAILECELAPGSVVSQVRLAKQFGVSRTPLREVLRLLEKERLVQSEHNRRVRISGLSVTDLEEVYAARIALEPLAARVGVATWTTQMTDRLAAHMDEMRMHAAADDYVEWQVSHRQFHTLLTSGSQGRLSQVLADLTDHADRYRRMYATLAPVAWQAALRPHEEILDCVVQRAPDRLASALARHIARAGLTTIAAADPGHDAKLVREALALAVHAPSRAQAGP
ncbi:GntR family transcriptional regulator [Jatrophihabitans fulvus]